MVLSKFHSEISSEFADEFIPYLYDHFNTDKSENDERHIKLQDLEKSIKTWAFIRSNEGKIVLDLSKCNQTYIRFKTNEMSRLLPETPEAKSGWNTGSHYYYEIVNRTGNSIFIQLSLSSKNITDNQREVCELINKISPSKYNKENWLWRIPLRTMKVDLADYPTKEELFSKLDKLLTEIINKQDKLINQFNRLMI